MSDGPKRDVLARSRTSISQRPSQFFSRNSPSFLMSGHRAQAVAGAAAQPATNGSCRDSSPGFIRAECWMHVGMRAAVSRIADCRPLLECPPWKGLSVGDASREKLELPCNGVGISLLPRNATVQLPRCRARLQLERKTRMNLDRYLVNLRHHGNLQQRQGFSIRSHATASMFSSESASPYRRWRLLTFSPYLAQQGSYLRATESTSRGARGSSHLLPLRASEGASPQRRCVPHLPAHGFPRHVCISSLVRSETTA